MHPLENLAEMLPSTQRPSSYFVLDSEGGDIATRSYDNNLILVRVGCHCHRGRFIESTWTQSMSFFLVWKGRGAEVGYLVQGDTEHRMLVSTLSSQPPAKNPHRPPKTSWDQGCSSSGLILGRQEEVRSLSQVPRDSFLSFAEVLKWHAPPWENAPHLLELVWLVITQVWGSLQDWVCRSADTQLACWEEHKGVPLLLYVPKAWVY